MTHAESDRCIRQFIGGDAAAADDIVEQARTSDQPTVLVAAALIEPRAHHLLVRAADMAVTTRDRQLVAVALLRSWKYRYGSAIRCPKNRRIMPRPA